MNIKILNVFFFFLLSITSLTGFSSSKILIIQHENWNHPVEKIFKKHSISLYKVHYSKDGTCPTFYATSQLPLEPKTINLPVFKQIFSDILKANSYYPYALVDEKKNLKINVGWKDKEKKFMYISTAKAATPSLCPGNMHANIDEDYDKFTVSTKMEKQILQSPYKTLLHNKEGKAFVAYLYSENASSRHEKNYNCLSGKMGKSLESRGTYYLYLYDVSANSFFPGRILPFKTEFQITLNTPGTDFFTLDRTNKNYSDLLLLSQSGGCKGLKYEVYGFAENQLFLQQYAFFTNKKHNHFYGTIGKKRKDGKIIAYGEYDNKQIKTVPLKILPN